MSSTRRVLIVDDRTERLNRVAAMLESQGCTNEVERQWIPALEIARLDPPALILAAMTLLVEERHALLRRCKAIPNLAAVPFIVLREQGSDPRDDELVMELGADAVLAYPDDAEAFIASLQPLIVRSAATRWPPSSSRVGRDELAPAHDPVLVSKLKQRIRVLEREQATSAEDTEHLRIALGAARMGTFVRDLKHQRVRWATTYKPMWEGHPRARESSIAELEETIHPDDLSGMRRAIQHAIDTNTEYEFDYRVTSEGRVRWIQARGRPYYDEHGNPDRVVGIFFEVTQRHLLEQQLRQTQKMEAVGLLAGGIAHDFNNILAAIMGNEELMRSKLRRGDEVATYLDEITRASRRAKNLVQQILAFSRDQQAEKSVLAPSSVLLETASLLRATVPADVELVTNIAPDAPKVLADPTQLQQVLLNLATNAWHALCGRPGQIELRLQAARVGTQQLATGTPVIPGRYAHFTVTDTGVGMTSDIVARAFDPFFTTKPKGHGTGLGLAVAREIVTGHRGVIWVTSTPGEGTSFHILIPATDGDAPAAKPDSAPRAPVQPEDTLKRVLYVDDEAALVRVMSLMLKPLGFQVEGFTDVEAALSRFRSDARSFDLAITDMAMPRWSGMDVAEALLALRPRLPIVLLSGYITTERRDLARSLGIREVLPKPVTSVELCAALDRALRPE